MHIKTKESEEWVRQHIRPEDQGLFSVVRQGTESSDTSRDGSGTSSGGSSDDGDSNYDPNNMDCPDRVTGCKCGLNADEMLDIDMGAGAQDPISFASELSGIMSATAEEPWTGELVEAARAAAAERGHGSGPSEWCLRPEDQGKIKGLVMAAVDSSGNTEPEVLVPYSKVVEVFRLRIAQQQLSRGQGSPEMEEGHQD